MHLSLGTSCHLYCLAFTFPALPVEWLSEGTSFRKPFRYPAGFLLFSNFLHNWFLEFYFSVQIIESRVLYMLGKDSATVP